MDSAEAQSYQAVVNLGQRTRNSSFHLQVGQAQFKTYCRSRKKEVFRKILLSPATIQKAQETSMGKTGTFRKE